MPVYLYRYELPSDDEEYIKRYVKKIFELAKVHCVPMKQTEEDLVNSIKGDPESSVLFEMCPIPEITAEMSFEYVLESYYTNGQNPQLN